MSKKHLLPVLLVLLAGSVVLVVGRSGEKAKESMASTRETIGQIRLLSQDVFTVSETSGNEGVQFTGEVTSPDQVLISSPVAGRVARLDVEEGESVKAGQRLVLIRSADIDSQVNSRKAAVEAAKADLQLAKSNFERQQSLFQQHFISKNALDDIANQVTAKSSVLASRQAELNQASADLASSVIVSPVDGVVASRSVTLGQEIGQHVSLMKIVSMRNLEIRADVPAAVVSQLQIGQKARMVVEGGNREFLATIRRINPATTEGSRNIRVFLAMEQPEQQIKVGMFVTGYFSDTSKPGTKIPASSIRQENQKAFVWVLTQDKHLQRRMVQVKPQPDQDNRVDVLSGLQQGEHVLVNPPATVTPGLMVVLDGA